VEDELHTIHSPSGVIPVPQVSDAILKAALRMSRQQRVQFGNIGLAAHIATDIGIAMSKEALDKRLSEKTGGSSNKNSHANPTG
jgi:hypothetical protein